MTEEQQKYKFKIQHYYKKWLCAFPLLGIALLIQYFTAQFIKSDLVFYASCVIIMGGLLTAYYFMTDKLRFFNGEGSYWTEDGALKLTLDNKTYEIRDVKELIGGTPNIFMYYYTYMYIKLPDKKLKIFGGKVKIEEDFNATELYPLFQLILRRENHLVQKELLKAKLDYWYVEE